MQRQPHSRFLGNRKHCLHEVRVIRPDLFRRVLTIERRLLDAFAEVLQVEHTRLVSPPLHFRCRVCVGRMEVIRCDRDTELP